MRPRISNVPFTAAFALTLCVLLPLTAAAQEDAVAITGATILTSADAGKIENATIVFKDGHIVAVGPDADVSVPSGAQVIDGTGKFVTAGIIDAHSHIAADAINEGSVSVSSMVSIKDVIDPTDISIYREAAGGTTTAHVMHGSANPIGGQNAIIKLRWGAAAQGSCSRAHRRRSSSRSERTRSVRTSTSAPACRRGIRVRAWA